ncbi:MAG: hypothetical protein WBL53_10075 [Pseudonocardiaceae bacterium]
MTGAELSQVTDPYTLSEAGANTLPAPLKLTEFGWWAGTCLAEVVCLAAAQG